MNKILYFFKSIKENITVASKRSGKSRLLITFDILWCGLKYGASPANYCKFQFFKLTDTKRKTYITNRDSEYLIKKYNQQDYRKVFENKVSFAETFQEFFGRDWVAFPSCGDAAYASFQARNRKVICKPNEGSQGKGIFILSSKDADWKMLRSLLHGDYIIESFIEQHPLVAEFCQNAVSCIRVITVSKDGSIYPVVANITFGKNHEIANASYGGITAQIDVNTGHIVSPGGDFDGKVYVRHPASNKEIKGFAIPFWEETMNMLSKAGKLIPQVGYVGWDVAITIDGPVLIEGNTSPGYTFFQIPELLGDQEGMKRHYKPFL